MWNQSWWLVSKELKLQWLAFLSTVIATIVIALISVLVLDQFVGTRFAGEAMPFNRFLLDLIFVGITPSFAVLFMSAPYLRLRTVWEDPFSKRMAFYRSLPIPLDVLAKSRTMFMLMTLLTLSTVFYATILIALPGRFFTHISLAEFIMFMLVWFGYALLMSGSSTYIEFGTSGKMLHLFPLFFLGMFALLVFILYNVSEKGIVEWSFIFVRHFGWGAVLFALLCGVLGCFGWYRMLIRRLANRDYL